MTRNQRTVLRIVVIFCFVALVKLWTLPGFSHGLAEPCYVNCGVGGGGKPIIGSTTPTPIPSPTLSAIPMPISTAPLTPQQQCEGVGGKPGYGKWDPNNLVHPGNPCVGFNEQQAYDLCVGTNTGGFGLWVYDDQSYNAKYAYQSCVKICSPPKGYPHGLQELLCFLSMLFVNCGLVG